jgi:hypothetical protein
MDKITKPLHIKPPDDEEEIVHITALYDQVGLPGCCGSVDVVHIPWGRCPAG